MFKQKKNGNLEVSYREVWHAWILRKDHVQVAMNGVFLIHDNTILLLYGSNNNKTVKAISRDSITSSFTHETNTFHDIIISFFN